MSIDHHVTPDGAFRGTAVGFATVDVHLEESASVSGLLRLKGRHDLSLLVGLIAASLCVFSGSVASALTYVDEIEGIYDLELVPGLVVLATAFSIHQARKHRLAKFDSRENARLADEAEVRAAQAEWLVVFGHALAAALGDESREAIPAVIARDTPTLLPGRDVWVLTRDRNHAWTSIVAMGGSSPADRERAARVALGETEPSLDREPRYTCFPLAVGETAMGVLGVAATPPLTEHEHRVLGAAAALMAVSLKNAFLVQQTREAGMRDQLTGFFNRAYALEMLEAEMRRAWRSTHPLSILMLDLDGLKMINDVRGHLCGDALIAATCATIRSALRGSDVKCRYGGDEFVLLLPETPIEGAERVADSLRLHIQSQQVSWNGDSIGMTASLGVTALEDADRDPLTLISRADAALSRAKASGRNAVCSSRDAGST